MPENRSTLPGEGDISNEEIIAIGKKVITDLYLNIADKMKEPAISFIAGSVTGRLEIDPDEHKIELWLMDPGDLRAFKNVAGPISEEGIRSWPGGLIHLEGLGAINDLYENLEKYLKEGDD